MIRQGKKPVIDPVCGMEVDPARTFRFAMYKGRQYTFCCPRCKDAFSLNPRLYVPRNIWSRLLDSLGGPQPKPERPCFPKAAERPG